MSDWRSILNEKEKYAAYLCSREWSEKREAVRRRAGGKCERCGVLSMDAVHHLTYARKYDEQLTDLQAICEPCHKFTHGKSEFDPLAGRRVLTTWFFDGWNLEQLAEFAKLVQAIPFHVAPPKPIKPAPVPTPEPEPAVDPLTAYFGQPIETVVAEIGGMIAMHLCRASKIEKHPNAPLIIFYFPTHYKTSAMYCDQKNQKTEIENFITKKSEKITQVKFEILSPRNILSPNK
jgi:hypothetical protein